MEEILASIRRIIADDDASKTSPRVAEPPTASARPSVTLQSYAEPSPLEIRSEESADPVGLSLEEQAADIFDLTAPVPATSSPQPEPGFAPAPMQSAALQFHKIERYSDANSREGEQKPSMPTSEEPSGAAEQLLSNATSAAVDAAFNTLAQTVLVQNGRTLEDLVREMLRPMLKSWLDDNLPGLVERLVRNEIERVARGR
jgi:cell pole-organizing protein PopZ